MRGTSLRLPILAALAVAAGCGAPPPAPEDALGPPVTVGLKAVESPDRSGGSQVIRLDATGTGSIPFANDAGKLLVNVADGKARLDTNGDGVIDGKDAPAAQDEETVKVRFRLGGQPAEYPIRIQGLMSKGYVVLGGCLALEGTLDGCVIRLIDSNLDGTFGEIGKDAIEVGAPAAPPDADVETSQKLYRFIAMKDRLVQVTAIDGGTRLTCRPYTGPTSLLTVQPAAPASSCTLTLLLGGDRMTVTVSERHPALLLPGNYRIQQSELVVPLENEKPSIVRRLSNALRGEIFPDGPRFINLTGDASSSGGEETVLEVRAGAQTVTVGPPFRLAFDAIRWSGRRDRVEIQAAWLAGAAGERYTPSCSGPENRNSTLTAFVRTGDREQKLSSLTYG